MNAMLLLCQCDSIVTKACGALIPVVQETYEAGTNCKDVAIAEAICHSFVYITAIVVLGSLVWRLMDYLFKGCQEKRKQKYDVENSKRKQKGDLLDKYLDLLKEQTKEYASIDEYEKQRKGIVDILLELVKNEKLVCLNPKPCVNSGETGVHQEKTDKLNDNKPKETGTVESGDKVKSADEIRHESIADLLEKLRAYYIDRKQPMTENQSKINRYRDTLEYLIQLSQKDELNKFSVEELKEILTDNNPTDENQNT